VVALGNARIINAANGRNTPGNLPNAGGAGGQSTAVKNVKRARGFIIGTGVLRHSNNTFFGPFYSPFERLRASK
jgi:hypothetical protein